MENANSPFLGGNLGTGRLISRFGRAYHSPEVLTCLPPTTRRSLPTWPPRSPCIAMGLEGKPFESQWSFANQQAHLSEFSMPRSFASLVSLKSYVTEAKGCALVAREANRRHLWTGLKFGTSHAVIAKLLHSGPPNHPAYILFKPGDLTALINVRL